MEEINSFSTHGHKNVAEKQFSCPRTRSMIQEVFRFRGRTNIMRVAVDDIDLNVSGETFIIPKGKLILSLIIILTNLTHPSPTFIRVCQ